MLENGITDYSFNDLSSDVEMALVESMINIIDICSDMTPESLIKFLKNLWPGEDNKDDQLAKLIESGFVNRCFVHLTNIYVQDKSKFLMINKTVIENYL